MTSNASAEPGSPPPSEMVHVGRDGWLFLIHGTNDVLAQFEPQGFPKTLVAGWRTLLEERVRLCRAHGARFFHLIVPEKITVYDHRLDGLAIRLRHSPAARIRRALWFSPARRAHVDLLGAFRARRDRTRLYLKTDTHWSIAGCHLAYTILCRRMGARPRADLVDPRFRESGPVSGDLGIKLDPPQSETVEGWRFPRTAERVHASALLSHFEAIGHVYGGGGGTQVIYRNAGPGIDPRRLVLFGDSYSHHTWLPKIGALTVMLAETFSEVHLVWSTAVDWAYVAQVRPDLVVTEIAERFMIELPPLAADIAAIEARAIARKIGPGA